MSKIGIGISIDVTKIDKSRLKNHSNGSTYMDLTIFIDTDNPDAYGQHGFISQSVSKEERAQGVKTPILGNGKVFYNDSAQSTPAAATPADLDDDIPF